MLCSTALIVATALGPMAARVSAAGMRAEEPPRLSRWLVIGGVGKYGRTPIHTDAIEAQLVTGTWKPPQEDDRVVAPDGRACAWQTVSSGDDGWIVHPALRGGYAHATVHSEVDCTALLAASGASIVYVNGQPRAGDPYGAGWLRHPIELHAGANHLLFFCQRGRVRAEISVPEHAILFNTGDTTLPDLVEGDRSQRWGAVPVINATDSPLTDALIEATCSGGATVTTPVPRIGSMTTRKVGFRMAAAPSGSDGEVQVRLRLLRGGPHETAGQELDATSLNLRIRRPTQTHKRTFVSGIDGSIQYFAVTPMHRTDESPKNAGLVLTLHGAGVEALNQAAAYDLKSWAHIVAPTNRRPFGFDWEDWGRLDALEVLDIAESLFDTDRHRTYLTGHSMGGHGVWHIGSLFADRFAAVAPSAGWISFSSYGGSGDRVSSCRFERMLRRAASPSDTLSRLRNLNACGVYILHGESDDNVPVAEARTMRAHLAGFHTDFAYYERPGAGHWWGDECVDWPPLFDFLRHHHTPPDGAVRQVEFTTSNPAVSATRGWATIAAQARPLEPSRIDLTASPNESRITGTTTNVLRLAIEPERCGFDQDGLAGDGDSPFQPVPLTLVVDGCEIKDVASHSSRVWLQRMGDAWETIPPPDPAYKGPHRYGPFKQAFDRRFIMVYGTQGTDEENAWAWAKARFDAETFGYRGNGSIDVVPDAGFDPRLEPDRNVILYGHAESNVVWTALLSESPVQVSSGRIKIGERVLVGDDLACLFIRPRPGSDVALVGAVTGSGMRGMRVTNALPYFVSGVAYPDYLVVSSEVLTAGSAGIKAAGFFGHDWSVTEDDLEWR